jgi:fermentation-respiration switch protein FrsA (DUF1100 family)
VYGRPVMSKLKLLLVVAIGGYGVLVAALCLGERALLYHPDPTRVPPAAAGLPQAEEVLLETEDGEKLVAWHVVPLHDKPIVLYFHGNGEIISWQARRFRSLVSEGTGLLAVSYRGYGGSTGEPTEPGLHRDARAAYAFAAARYAPQRIAVWGHSIGTGVAVALAAERPIAKLILEAPFTSTADLAARIFPIVPVRLLMKDQFRSDELIAQVKVPVLIMHGARDDAIPIAFGERLYRLVRGPKKFVRFPAGGHIELDAQGAMDAVHAFLAGNVEIGN